MGGSLNLLTGRQIGAAVSRFKLPPPPLDSCLFCCVEVFWDTFGADLVLLRVSFKRLDLTRYPSDAFAPKHSDLLIHQLLPQFNDAEIDKNRDLFFFLRSSKV